jgi:hypothetical protein
MSEIEQNSLNELNDLTVLQDIKTPDTSSRLYGRNSGDGGLNQSNTGGLDTIHTGSQSSTKWVSDDLANNIQNISSIVDIDGVNAQNTSSEILSRISNILQQTYNVVNEENDAAKVSSTNNSDDMQITQNTIITQDIQNVSELKVPDFNDTPLYTDVTPSIIQENYIPDFSLDTHPHIDGHNSFAVLEDNSFIITASDLLSTVSGEGLYINNIHTDHGTITDNGDGTWTFTPEENWHGDLEIYYDVTTASGETITTYANVFIESENDDPTSELVELDDTIENVSFIIYADDLLKTASDIDGDTLYISNVTANNGELIYNNDNTWTYNPHNFDGDVRISYTISDGNGGETQGMAEFNVAEHIHNEELIYKTISEHYTTSESHLETYIETEMHTETYIVQEPRTETYIETEMHTETYIVQEPRTETYTETEMHTETHIVQEPRTETYIETEMHTETYIVQEPRTETYTEIEQQSVDVYKDFSYDGDGRNANKVEVNSLEEALLVSNGANHENGNLVFKNINKSTFNIDSDTNETFVIKHNSNDAHINLGDGDNVVIFETNPGKNVEITVGSGDDVLILPGNISDYNMNDLQFEHNTFSGTITGPDNMSLNIHNFDTIKFADDVKGDVSLVKETQIIDVEVEHTREVMVDIEYTREVPVDVEHTREVMVDVEYTREVPVDVEHTREIMVDVEYTREVPVDVEHTREVMVDVEYTREVPVDVEHTREVMVDVDNVREVQVIDEEAMMERDGCDHDLVDFDLLYLMTPDHNDWTQEQITTDDVVSAFNDVPVIIDPEHVETLFNFTNM